MTALDVPALFNQLVSQNWPIYQLYGLTLQSDFCFANRLSQPEHSETTGNSSQPNPELRFTCRTEAPINVDWHQQKPIYTSQCRTETGDNSFFLYEIPSDRHSTSHTCTVVHFTDTADYYLWEDFIYCHLFNPAYDYWVEIGFLGSIMSIWLETHKRLALHASAVVINRQAVGFLGSKQGGKTSLAAMLTQSGHQLLTDDILPIQQQGKSLLGCPGYPQMRMWPELAQHFTGSDRSWPKVHPNLTKLRIPVTSETIGEFCDCPRPLTCLYLPERRDPNLYGKEISITPIPAPKAMVELLYYAFAAPVLPAFPKIQKPRFYLLADIIKQVQVRHLTYPNGYQYLPQVKAAIVEDIEAISKESSH